MYTVLDPELNVVGFLSNKGRGANDFWGDTISQQIADTQDILGNVDLTVDNVSRNIDVSGNTKNWNHTLNGISFNNTLVGAQVENGYYLLYQDDANKRHYLMQLTSVSENVTPGGQHYKTATGVNAALYDFSRMIVDAKEFYASPTGTQTLGSLQNILRYILGHAGWNVNVEDYNFPDITYSISDGVSVQSVLQDIIKLFEVDVDAYVTMTPQGQLAQRVVSFRQQLGADSGVTIRYGKNMTDMTREELSDSIYTKLYVQGANSLKLNATNNGLPYIVDEAANKLYNPVGASSSPETFREGIVINSMITDEQSLLAWGKKQLQALNHPRINYTISSIASTEAGLGDTIRVQDLYASQKILLTSRVIQKTISFANPTTNTLVLGEYSSVIGDKTKNVDLIAKLGQVADDITVVSEAAVKTKVIAEGASSVASQASSAASSAVTHANAVEEALSSAFTTAKSDAARLYIENKADTASLNSLVTEQLASASAQRSSLAVTTSSMVADAKATSKSLADSAYAGAMAGVTSAGNLIAGVSAAVRDMGSTVTANKSAIAKAGNDLATGLSSAAAYADSLTAKVGNSASAAVSSVSSDVNGIRAEFDSAKKTTHELSVATNSLSVGASGIATKLTEVTSTASGAMSAAASVAANVSGISASFNNVSNTVANWSNNTRNYLLGTKVGFNVVGNGAVNQGTPSYVLSVGNGYNLQQKLGAGVAMTLSFDWSISGETVAGNFGPQFNGSPWGIGAPKIVVDAKHTSGHYVVNFKLPAMTTDSAAKGMTLRLDNLTGTVSISNMMLVLGSTQADWQPAPEDIENSLSSASASYSAGIAGLAASIKDTQSNVNGLTSATNSLSAGASGFNAKITSLAATDSATNQAVASMAADASGLHASFNQLSNTVTRNVVSGAVDLNTYVTSGKWFFSGSQTNAPQSGWAYVDVDVDAPSAYRLIQTWTYDQDASLQYSRYSTDNGKTWSSWVKAVQASDVTTAVNSASASYSAGINGLSADIKTVDTNAKGYATAAQNSAIATASQNATALVNTATTSLSNGIAKTYATQTQLTQTASQFTVTATSLQNQVNSMGQINQLANTEFNPDAAGWYLQGNEMTGISSSDWYITVASRIGVGGSNGITIYNSASETGMKFIRSEKILLAGQNQALSYSLRIAQNTIGTNGRIAVEIEYFNSKDQQIDYQGYQNFTDTKDWNTLTVNNITSSVTTDLQYARLAVYVVGASTKVYFGRPIVVFGTTVSGYVPGNYNNNSRVAALEVSADSIAATAQDTAKSLSATATIAANGVTIATQASNAANSVAITASGAVTQIASVSNSVKTVTNTLTETANQVTQEIADRKSGDTAINTQLSTMNQSVVKNAANITTLTQTANAYQVSVSSNGIRYVRFNGQGNTDNNGTHFKLINIWNNKLVDLASGLSASVSGTGSISGSGAKGATDGNINTYIGITREPNADNYIMYDLGSVHYDLQEIDVSMWTSTRIYYSVNVQVSLDGLAWRTVFSENIKATGTTPDVKIGLSSVSNSTVLSLFSDNFEAGIKSHTGALLAGINADASGTRIAGKLISLDGNATVLPGFTLTVDHLVGNTAQFIKTGWDSAYSNIQIDGDGITIASKDNGAKTIFENGDTHWWSPRGEDIGYIGITRPIASQTNADYMTIGVNGWQTTTKGDSHYDYGASDFYGGDGIMFGVTDANTDSTGAYRKLMTWESSLTAGYLGVQTGWHAWEQFEFHNTVKIDGNLNTGGDINLGWTLRKNGTGFYPAHFQSVPGIHIAGTGAGIVFDESANKFYVIMGGHANWIDFTKTGGQWNSGSWDN